MTKPSIQEPPEALFPEVKEKKFGCLQECMKLQYKMGGDIFLVVGLYNGTAYAHYYLILPNQSETDYALNSWENGYFSYPRLLVEEVKSLGRKFDAKEL